MTLTNILLGIGISIMAIGAVLTFSVICMLIFMAIVVIKETWEDIK